MKICIRLLGFSTLVFTSLEAQNAPTVTERNDSVSIRIVDTDLRVAVQALSRFLDRPVIFGAINNARVTLETPRAVHRAQVPTLLRTLLEAHNLELLADSGAYRVNSRPPQGRPEAVRSNGVVPTRPGLVDLFVIRLRHARAPDVAAVVNALYGRASALGELGAAPPTLSDQLRDNRVPSVEQNITPGSVAPARNATLTGEVTIVPDLRTNSLMIRSNANDFQLIRAAVEQIDIRPLQVLIEVLIAEVRRDRSFSLGLSSNVPGTKVPHSTNTTAEGSTTGIGAGDFALRVMNLGRIDWDITLRAAAARGDVTILSRPVILTANNERAEIIVGSQRPFVQVQRSLPTDAPVRDQVIQYKDVGTVLSVRPTISMDGYVMLDVVQEVNAATTETAFDAPVISTRSVTTQLLVRDDQTAVLGGLADRQRDVTRAGVPILSGFPLIGWIFGRSARRTTETELFLFLRPRIIRSDQDMEDAARGIQNNARHIGEQIRTLPVLVPARPDSTSADTLRIRPRP